VSVTDRNERWRTSSSEERVSGGGATLLPWRLRNRPRREWALSPVTPTAVDGETSRELLPPRASGELEASGLVGRSSLALSGPRGLTSGDGDGEASGEPG